MQVLEHNEIPEVEAPELPAPQPGEQIEMQVLEHNETPEVEAPELPAPQPAIEQACGGDANPSSSDYQEDFDIRPATTKTVEAGKSEEQVEVEEISVPSNKGAKKGEEEVKAPEPDMDVAEEGEEEVFDTRL
nr:zinc metalloprotease ZmpB-like isoform X2 [Pocillopora verrucosa]